MTWTCEDWNDKPFMRWTGARVVLSEGGNSRIELQVEERHRGAAGTEAVNGAILSYLHDVVQGAAIRSLLGDEVQAIATLNLNVSFLALATSGDLLVGQGRVLSLHTAVGFAESEFVNSSGQVCCRATGTFRIMRKRMAGRAPNHTK